MSLRKVRGFTLIELLTVIAIIALLAAILFPVFGQAKERTRQATCMSNLHKLYVGATQYFLDNGKWPEMLFAPAQDVYRLPVTTQTDYTKNPPNPINVVDMASVRRGFLYKTYIKDVEVFHCPNAIDRDRKKVVVGYLPGSSPWSNLLGGTAPTFGTGPFTFSSIRPSYDSVPVPFYAYDSYDVSSFMLNTGKQAKDSSGNPVYEVHYTVNWNAAQARGIDTRQDFSNQFMYGRSLNAEKTILTWCNYHVTSGQSEKCPTILASGTAKVYDWKQLQSKGWGLLN